MARTRWTLFLLLVALACALRPLPVGERLADSAGLVLVHVLYVVVPGWVAWRRLARDPEDELRALFMAGALGSALLVLCFVVLVPLGLRALLVFLPLPWIALGFLGRGRRPRPAASAPACLLLAGSVVLLAILRSSVDSGAEWYLGYETDAVFHAENAGLLRQRWPPVDPRLAGEPLNYHLFSYVFPSVAEQVGGWSARAIMLSLGSAFVPAWFALGMFVAARALGARPWVSALCAAALVLFGDLGEVLEEWTGASLGFASYFYVGLYESASTAFSLFLLLALLVLVRSALERPASPRSPLSPLSIGEIGLVLLLAFVIAGAKGSTTLPLWAGLAGVLLYRLATGGGQRRALLLLLAAIFAGMLAPVLWLSFGEGSRASMFTFDLLAAQGVSPFERTALAALGFEGEPPLAARLALALPWTAGYLGVVLVLALAWAVLGARPRRDFELCLLLGALAGFVPAFVLSAPGVSQLFFSYVSILCLTLLGAAGLEAALASRARGRLALLAGLPLLLPQAWVVGETVRRWPTGKKPFAAGRTVRVRGDASAHPEAFAWIRENLPPDAVLLVREPRLSVASWAERAVFYESENASARYFTWLKENAGRERPGAEPYARRRELQRRFLDAPSAEDLGAIRRELGTPAPLFALVDRVRVAGRDRPKVADLIQEIAFDPIDAQSDWGRALGAECVYTGPTLKVWRIPGTAR